VKTRLRGTRRQPTSQRPNAKADKRCNDDGEVFDGH
jgi:hypothetical protein